MYKPRLFFLLFCFSFFRPFSFWSLTISSELLLKRRETKRGEGDPRHTTTKSPTACLHFHSQAPCNRHHAINQTATNPKGSKACFRQFPNTFTSAHCQTEFSFGVIPYPARFARHYSSLAPVRTGPKHLACSKGRTDSSGRPWCPRAPSPELHGLFSRGPRSSGRTRARAT